MGPSYGLLHWAVHFLLALLLSLYFNLGYFGSLMVFLITIAIDLDHIPALLKHGLGYLWGFSRPIKFPLHRIAWIILSASLSPLLSFNLFIGLALITTALHLLWDLTEDVMIFKMGIKHWL